LLADMLPLHPPSPPVYVEHGVGDQLLSQMREHLRAEPIGPVLPVQLHPPLPRARVLLIGQGVEIGPQGLHHDAMLSGRERPSGHASARATRRRTCRIRTGVADRSDGTTADRSPPRTWPVTVSGVRTPIRGGSPIGGEPAIAIT